MSLLDRIPVVKTVWKQAQFSLFQRKWRKLNPHNQTGAGCIFPTDILSVGKNTYGVLNLYSYFPANEKLTIGNYVSIAPEVKFVLGGNHQSLTATTYPVKSVFSGIQMEVDSLSKGEIMVEDEVWIGAEAMILSGITLGKGCIVAARSVVTKDVPPYAIVGGNPARIIKYRFSEEVIRQLLPLKLINLPENVLKENSDLFYTPITSPSDLGKLLDLFATYSQPAR